MELREYMSIRRSYNLVRKVVPANRRLTFEEFAILCRLNVRGTSFKTSEIAEYQGALRPTITHRTSHLAKLGFIKQDEGAKDRRNIVCFITEKGEEAVEELSKLTCARIAPGQALSRTSFERIVMYVDAMGSLYCKAADMVLLAILDSPKDALSITEIVDALGLLQPTVSMSLSALAENGLVQRKHDEALSKRVTMIELTPAGELYCKKIVQQIEDIVVKRKSRTSV